MQSIIQNPNTFNPAGGGQSVVNHFYDTLPRRPYCTDELGSLFVRVKDQAIKRRYIQPNDPKDLYWLVYDVDRPTAHFDWYDLHAPPPNITATNMQNGHAHLFYGLEVPVYKVPNAHQQPIRYAASIDVALTQKLQADPGYAGLICKNPLHKKWNVQIWEPVPYDLNWIAEYLDLEPYKDRRKHLPPIGLGRNCTLFEVTRHWAYSQIRKEDVFFSKEIFIDKVIQYATARNGEFPVPLSYSEVKATGKSIGKWTWRNMSQEGFKKWGDSRRKKSILIRQTKRDQRADEIRAFKLTHPEVTNREIAEKFEVSLWTVAKLRLSVR